MDKIIVANVNKKFKLTGGYLEHGYIKLYRIKALRDFGDVKKGDIGGYVEKEDNLSHEGECWIYNDAKVYGNAVVFKNAKIKDSAQIYEYAYIGGESKVFNRAVVHGRAKVVGGGVEIYHDARVFDTAVISHDAKVSGDAVVFGNARVLGRAHIYNGAKVYENAGVFGDAEVFDAIVRGSSSIGFGEKVSRDIINILGLTYPITVTDNHIRIGCKIFTKEKWASFKNKEVDKMHEDALQFWKKHKKFILSL